MKGAVASVEIYVFEAPESPRRLTLTIAAPERSGDGSGWQCRVALANVHRPKSFDAPDSVLALAAAVEQARRWVDELSAQGHSLCRDRAGLLPFEWPRAGHPIE